ncbi:MAG: FHA domain-containing protein [Bryobacteraceae bacterium]
MRAIVEILSGLHTGRKLEVFPGRQIRFGRTGKSDLALTDDSYLSSVHFGLESDGEKCVLYDLGSSNGTFLNGTRVSQATLQHGDSISAGQTNFLMHLYSDADSELPAAPPATQSAPFVRVVLPEPAAKTATIDIHGDPLPLSVAHQRLARLLRAEERPLYALLDTARDRAISALLDSSGAPVLPVLEPGADGPAGFAPCLICLQDHSRLLEDLIRVGWSRHWGVYLTAMVPVERIREHLIRFLRLHTEDGEIFCLRVPDPRILRVLLATSTPREAEQLFGPVASYMMEGPDPNTVLRFEPTPLGTRQSSEALAAAAP